MLPKRGLPVLFDERRVDRSLAIGCDIPQRSDFGFKLEFRMRISDERCVVLSIEDCLMLFRGPSTIERIIAK
jgi:hypothetical protein